MQIPLSGRKKALIIVDVEPLFLTVKNSSLVKNILTLLGEIAYDMYVEASFFAGKGSIWDKQKGAVYPQAENTETVKEILQALEGRGALHVVKNTKSAFKGDQDIEKFFREAGIEEVHIVGLDTNDCVLATAYEAFDLGFLTYVLEEGCRSSTSDEIHEAALALLRKQNLTNNSCREKILFQEVELS